MSYRFGAERSFDIGASADPSTDPTRIPNVTTAMGDSFMLLAHAFGLFTHPDREWRTIAKEHASPTRLYVAYVSILALIGAVCAYISTTQLLTITI